jgi:hypothetical protein
MSNRQRQYEVTWGNLRHLRGRRAVRSVMISSATSLFDSLNTQLSVASSRMVW